MNPGTRDIGGIFDASVLDDYLKVYVHYCTSDGHMGDTDATGSVGYIFRGSEVVHAVVQTLEDDWGITSSAETERVLFGGASAGGRGGMVHLDYVREKYAPVEVVGILDSPLWVDLDPPDFSSKIGEAERGAKDGWSEATAKATCLAPAFRPSPLVFSHLSPAAHRRSG